MSGWIFLTMGLIVAGSDFLLGRYLAGLGPDGPALYSGGKRLSTAALNRVGRLVMLLSPLLFLVFAAFACGVVPTEAIDPIAFGTGGAR